MRREFDSPWPHRIVLDTIYKNLIQKLPKNVSYVTEVLEKSGFEAYLVGGCVRDLLMERSPKDWDITTNAKPEEIVKLFEKTVYENKFGTVGVCVPRESSAKWGVSKEGVSGETDIFSFGDTQDISHETEYEIIEVTPYRLETKYTDFRHPDEVKFSDKLENDLKRRDFTVNAMALSPKGQLIDLYKGQEDIKDKILRTVGTPTERFNEDALRMLRAVRFSVQLNFTISQETSEGIFQNSHLIKNISAERIHDEFVKIIMSEAPSAGIVMLQKFGLLKYIIPELEEGIGCEQSGEHIYDVYNHLLQALQHSADKNWPLEVRLSALFHDIGKPKSRRNTQSEPTKNSGAFALGDERAWNPRRIEFLSSRPAKEKYDIAKSASNLAWSGPLGRGPDKLLVDGTKSKKKYTFYGHEVVGARMAKKILERLKFSKKETELVEKLVRNHMFFSDTEQITLSAVRRIITKVGAENIWTLMNVRECDRVGMKKKEAPYRLRKYHAMIEEALHDPISVSQLKINGEFLIKNLGIKPGPRMGWMLHALLEEVLEDPSKNTEEKLSEMVKKLDELSDSELKKLGESGKEKKEELEEEEINKLHQKHGVKK